MKKYRLKNLSIFNKKYKDEVLVAEYWINLIGKDAWNYVVDFWFDVIPDRVELTRFDVIKGDGYHYTVKRKDNKKINMYQKVLMEKTINGELYSIEQIENAMKTHLHNYGYPWHKIIAELKSKQS